MLVLAALASAAPIEGPPPPPTPPFPRAREQRDSGIGLTLGGALLMTAGVAVVAAGNAGPQDAHPEGGPGLFVGLPLVAYGTVGVLVGVPIWSAGSAKKAANRRHQESNSDARPSSTSMPSTSPMRVSTTRSSAAR